MEKSYKLFIFDFDGTLGDTQECIIASYQQAIRINNLPLVEREQIIHCMGLSLPQVLKKLTNDALEESVYEKLMLDYRSLYKELLPQKTKLFPQVIETLQQLKEKNRLLSVATSKKTDLVTLNCKYLHIANFFDLYIGDDKVSQPKPHPEMLATTLTALNINKSDAVMIGDSTFDIEMGNRLGMDTIAVTWGAHPEASLRRANPTRTIHQFSELLAFV